MSYYLVLILAHSGPDLGCTSKTIGDWISRTVPTFPSAQAPKAKQFSVLAWPGSTPFDLSP
jgi:hypothetical protein